VIPTCRTPPLERLMLLYRTGRVVIELELAPCTVAETRDSGSSHLAATLHISGDLKKFRDCLQAGYHRSDIEVHTGVVLEFYYESEDQPKWDYMVSTHHDDEGELQLKLYGEDLVTPYGPITEFLFQVAKGLDQ